MRRDAGTGGYKLRLVRAIERHDALRRHGQRHREAQAENPFPVAGRFLRKERADREGGPALVAREPTLGGSVPMYLFRRGDVPVIGVPIVNHDNNQHAANENLRIQNLWDGIELFAAMFAELGR